MKTLTSYIKESFKPQIKLDAMKGYGIPEKVSNYILNGTEKELKNVIEEIPFVPEDVEKTINSSGLTYNDWKADKSNCSDSRIILRTKDKEGNLLTLTIKKTR